MSPVLLYSENNTKKENPLKVKECPNFWRVVYIYEYDPVPMYMYDK